MTPPTSDGPQRRVCADLREGDVLERYLADDLPDAEAEAFEEHYFGCDDCWGLVRSALDARAAFASPRDASARRGRSRRVWPLLLPAAGLAAVFAGLMITGVWPSGGTEEVYRGVDRTMDVEVASAREGSLQLSWSPHPGADQYVVRLQTGAGALVLERRASESRLDVDRTALAALPEGSDLFVRVEALDELRRTVARSPVTRVRVPAP